MGASDETIMMAMSTLSEEGVMSVKQVGERTVGGNRERRQGSSGRISCHGRWVRRKEISGRVVRHQGMGSNTRRDGNDTGQGTRVSAEA